MALFPCTLLTPSAHHTGAALATAGAELISFFAYIYYMVKKGLLSLTSLVRIPKVSDLLPLFRGGLAVQLRSLALNLGLLSITRATLTMDVSGTPCSPVHRLHMERARCTSVESVERAMRDKSCSHLTAA
jgi:hypothetical protein